MAIDERDRTKIADRAWSLYREHFDPSRPEGAAPQDWADIVWDIERTVRSGQPAAGPQEACLAQAIREYDQPAPPSPDEQLAEKMKAAKGR